MDGLIKAIPDSYVEGMTASGTPDEVVRTPTIAPTLGPSASASAGPRANTPSKPRHLFIATRARGTNLPQSFLSYCAPREEGVRIDAVRCDRGRASVCGARAPADIPR